MSSSISLKKGFKALTISARFLRADPICASLSCSLAPPPNTLTLKSENPISISAVSAPSTFLSISGEITTPVGILVATAFFYQVTKLVRFIMTKLEMQHEKNLK